MLPEIAPDTAMAPAVTLTVAVIGFGAEVSVELEALSEMGLLWLTPV